MLLIILTLCTEIDFKSSIANNLSENVKSNNLPRVFQIVMKSSLEMGGSGIKQCIISKYIK